MRNQPHATGAARCDELQSCGQRQSSRRMVPLNRRVPFQPTQVDSEVTTMNDEARPDRVTQNCPGCGRLLRIPAEYEGQTVKCKFCEHDVQVGVNLGADAPGGLSHVGAGTAFQIERTWSAPIDRESRYTVVRHPAKAALRGFTMAVECFGPARIQVAGIKAGSSQAISMGKVQPGETRVVPLDDVHHAYVWLDKGASVSARIIVGRCSV